MPNITNWLSESVLNWDDGYIVGLKTTSIIVIRKGVAQTAQTVRIETAANRRTVERQETGISGYWDATIIGYKNHPTIADTDIQYGDVFGFENSQYFVIMILPDTRRYFQAFARVRV